MRQTDYAQTALHLAAMRPSNQALKVLLEAGCDTSLRDCDDRLPLERAHMYEGHLIFDA